MLSSRSFFTFLILSISAWGQTAQSDAPSAVKRLPKVAAASLSGAYRRPVAFLLPDADLEDPKRSHLERRFLSNLATDQVEFVKGAGRFRVKDLKWALPLAGATGLTLATDPDASRQLAGSDPNRWKTSQDISNGSVIALGALAGSTYLWGLTSHDHHKRETGVLAAEAATGALIDTEVLKQIFGRDRPDVGTGEGLFFNSPRKFPSDASFVSAHAMISWSIASVIAHEYPGWLTQTAVYGLAGLTSATRVTGKKHFPTDVLIGSALGWYIGHQVYRAHHDPELGGMDIGTFTKPEPVKESSRNIGSTYVPLESWVYDAIDRLAGMGIAGTDMTTMRPWTRLECARIVQEAESNHLALGLPDKSIGGELIAALRKEFQYEYDVLDGKPNRTAQVESLYARALGISGEPLRDGYHFGQTVYNDYGRPFAEGVNFVSGGSGYAAHGPWSVYFRAEYQHAPSAPALPFAARSAISSLEHTPIDPATPFDDVNRVRILDAYAAFTWNKLQFSFGKQSLWWGPDEEGALNYSNNAEPVNMFRVSTVNPLKLPWIFGAMKAELFLGQLEGHRFVNTSRGFFGPHLDKQPYIEGLKVGFKPTENFEFGVSVTSVWGGAGVPITFGSFRRSFSPGNTIPGQPLDPGDRRTGFDFKYRVPGLRRWLTIYNDALAEDEINPIGYPRRSAHAPGIFVSHIPGLERLDFRGEGYWTDLPGLRNLPGTWYFNNHYLSGYTNEGFLLGHPVGRQGRGYSLKGTYWFAPQTNVGVGYRHIRVNPDFLQGGDIDDYTAKGKWHPRDEWTVDGGLQYERWRFPLLASGRQSNVTTWLQVTFTPKWSLKR